MAQWPPPPYASDCNAGQGVKKQPVAGAQSCTCCNMLSRKLNCIKLGQRRYLTLALHNAPRHSRSPVTCQKAFYSLEKAFCTKANATLVCTQERHATVYVKG